MLVARNWKSRLWRKLPGFVAQCICWAGGGHWWHVKTDLLGVQVRYCCHCGYEQT